jgi:hypothetical protein
LVNEKETAGEGLGRGDMWPPPGVSIIPSFFCNMTEDRSIIQLADLPDRHSRQDRGAHAQLYRDRSNLPMIIDILLATLVH